MLNDPGIRTKKASKKRIQKRFNSSVNIFIKGLNLTGIFDI